MFLIVVVLYYLQLVFIKGCFLTQMEFGNVREGFYYHYLTLVGFKPDLKSTNFIVDCIPAFVLIVGIVIQEVFGIVPLISFFE
jgi:hypothetical protein